MTRDTVSTSVRGQIGRVAGGDTSSEDRLTVVLSGLEVLHLLGDLPDVFESRHVEKRVALVDDR